MEALLPARAVRHPRVLGCGGDRGRGAGHAGRRRVDGGALPRPRRRRVPSPEISRVRLLRAAGGSGLAAATSNDAKSARLSRRSRESRQFRVVRPEIGAVTADRREIFPKFGTNVPGDGTIVVIVTTMALGI